MHLARTFVHNNFCPMQEFMNQIWLDNEIRYWLLFAGTFLVVIIFNRWISTLLGNFLFQIFKRMAPGRGKHFTSMLLHPMEYVIALLAIMLASQWLVFPTALEFEVFGVSDIEILQRSFLLLLILAFTWLSSKVIDFFGEVLVSRAELTEEMADDQLALFTKDVLEVLLYILAIFLVLGSVFHLNITSLLAGAGLAGLAIALAAQDSLQNLLGGVSIFSEKPFVVGDLIEVNGIMGSVEKVGFRSTRLRTVDKTFVTLPNKMLMENPINNLTERTFRRVKMVIGVTYDATEEQMRGICTAVIKFLNDSPETTEDHTVHFDGFGPSSKDLMVIYQLKDVAWTTFLKNKENINYAIMRIVKEHGADFAFPTQTMIVEAGNTAASFVQQKPEEAPKSN